MGTETSSRSHLLLEKIINFRNRWFPTPLSVLTQANEAIDRFEQNYGQAARDDRKANMIAVFHARRALDGLSPVRNAKSQRAQIVQKFAALIKSHEEIAPGVNTILWWFKDTYRKS